jgi:hypothetical protein
MNYSKTDEGWDILVKHSHLVSDCSPESMVGFGKADTYTSTAEESAHTKGGLMGLCLFFA